MTAIRCSCQCHGTSLAPVLGTVENNRDPAAPYGFLCTDCADRWARAPWSSERTVPPLTAVLKIRAHCPAETEGG